MTIQIIVDIRKSSLQPLDMAFNAWADTGISLKETAVLRSKHFDELTAAREKIPHLASPLVRQWPYRWFYPQAEKSEYLGVNAIGLSQDTDRASEISHLARFNNNYLQEIGMKNCKPRASRDARSLQ